MSAGAVSRPTDRTFWAFNAALSAGALGFLAWLLLVRRGGESTIDLRFLPTVNAALNATAAMLLAAGWIAIRRGAKKVHQYLMVSAFAASSLFLVCYLVYHWVHGDTKYQGTGAMRVLYLAILASHVLLSMAIVPLSLGGFWFAWTKRFATHKKIGKVTLPIWLYVSVTGVVIYFMLRSGIPTRP
jgi:putative membrane protein